jgi:hypothetical protein
MLETALRIYRGPGERPGQAGALSLLAGIQWRTGEYRAAIKTLQAALRIYGDAGNRLGQASTIAEIGVVRRWAGDYQGAAMELDAPPSVTRKRCTLRSRSAPHGTRPTHYQALAAVPWPPATAQPKPPAYPSNSALSHRNKHP